MDLFRILELGRVEDVRRRLMLLEQASAISVHALGSEKDMKSLYKEFGFEISEKPKESPDDWATAASKMKALFAKR